MKYFRFIISIAILTLGLILAEPSYAATLVVTKTADTIDGFCNADCSLREAIAEANVSAGSDIINFDPTVFSSAQTITLTNGQLTLTVFDSVTINGPGANLLTISGNNQSRMFFSNASSLILNINNLTLSQGFATNGGAIYAGIHELILSNVVITGNTAAGADEGPAGFAGLGGGVYSTSTILRITNSTISNNLASGILVPNQNGSEYGSSGGGGGIFSTGISQTTIINCTFANNMARGISSSTVPASTGNPGSGGGAYGGAIYGIFSIRVVNSVFTNNTAVAGNGGTVLSFGTSGDGGGAIGAALYSSGSRILNSTFNGNSATAGNGGNGISVPGNGGPAIGGAIFDNDLKIANTTIVNNTATAGTGRTGGNAQGGGIYGGSGGSNQWSVISSTITGNSVGGGAGTMTNGQKQGGGVYSSADTGPSSLFRNNIVAENTSASGADVFGTFINASNNLIGNGDGSTGITNGASGNQVGTTASPINPGLAALADNGGFTPTRALIEGSLAINAGNGAQAINPFTSQPLQFDQRGFQRVSPVGGAMDIGAYEYGAATVPVTTLPDLQNASDSGVSNTDNLTMATAPVFDIANVITGSTVELLRNGTPVASATAVLTTGAISLTDPSPPADGAVLYTSRQSIPGATSPASTTLMVTFDHTAPTVTINQAAGQSDPTRILPVNFTAIFSEPSANLSTSDISLTGSTANVSTAIITVNFTDNVTRNIQVRNVTANGFTITASIPASTFEDFAGNVNVAASTSTDNTVTLDNVAPNVTINQAIGQSDPTGSQPVNFTVTFTESVTGFSASDVSLAGSTANVSAAIVNVTGSGSVYTVSVGNVRSSGQVRASVPAGAAQDATGNASLASTSTDNTITVVVSRPIADFDGDGKTDLSIFRPALGEWWYLRSSDSGNYAAQFGASTDKLTPGDFTGDGKTDIAFWRPSNGEWFVLRSEDSSYYSYPFGTTGDIPAAGDFDGDGKADSTIFRPSTATWYIRRSSDGGATIQQFGQNGDVPVVADYDGDGKSDIAIFRPAVGEWWLNRSTAGGIAFQFGNSADKPTPGDFTGDGKADVAFWRPSTGEWFVLRSENQSYFSFPFGTNGDVPAPGDYDGDGTFDAAVFRPSSSTWYAQRSTAGTLIQTFGQSGDIPVPSAFVP